MMVRIVIGALLTLSVASGAAAQEAVMGRPAVVPVGEPAGADMTPEETLVRTAYAKFAYAAEQGVVYQLATELEGSRPKDRSGLSGEQRLLAAHVAFKLSDFVVGNLTDIIGRKAVDLVTPPGEEMLAADTPVFGFGRGEQPFIYAVQPRWEPSRGVSPEVVDATLGELHEREWGSVPENPVWQRYASYSVSVTFQGKTQGPYKALFVFGHDPKGNAMVMPEDAITDSIALATVMTMHLFPSPFVSSRLRSYSVVADWVRSHQRSDSTCSRGRRDVCCDLTRLQCGPGSDDVAEGLSMPVTR
jgi:hypothetical protein